MRPRHEMLWFAVALACLQGGCGTALNLWAPPTQVPSEGLALPSTCMPLGGTFRSALFGGFYVVAGVGEGAEEVGQGGLLKGAGMVGAGLAALVIDTPLSFAGDLVTLPVACARQQGAPWATWWGEQAAPKTPGPLEVRPPQPPAETADSSVSQATAPPAATGAAGRAAAPGGAPSPWPH